jgi:hypothetical protein
MMGKVMLETAIGVIGTALLGVIAWAVRINSDVSVLKADKVSLKELLDVRLENISMRLDRIEQKLDKE